MAASDNVQPDQFIRVFHSSFSRKPVHKLRSSYTHGDAIFAGTRASSTGRGSWRPYTHVYDIPTSIIRPELWGDDLKVNNYSVYTRGKNNEPIGPFEHIPADPSLVDQNTAIKFRNGVEDRGSISHIFHKDSVKGGIVKYVGTEGDQQRSRFGKIKIFQRGTL